MSFVEIAIHFTLGFLQTGLTLFFLYKMVGINPKFKIFHLIFVNLAVNILVLIPFLFWNDAFWRPVWGIGLIVFTAVFFFGGNIRNRLLYVLIALILVFFSDIISSSVAAYMFSGISIDPASLLYHIITPLLNLTSIFLLLGGMLHINTKGKLYLPGIYWGVAMSSFTAVLVGYVILVTIDNSDTSPNLLIVVGGTILILFTILLYFAFYFVCRYFTKVNENSLMAIQNEMLEKYMLQKHESDRMIKMLSHDLRHNLGRLKTLTEQNGDEQAAEILAEYDRRLEQIHLYDVGNDIANAILNEKQLMAQKDNITFMVIGSFFDGLTITRMDLCSLLGNLLDNALETAAQVKDTALRRVELRINRKGHQLLLSLENDYAAEPQYKDNAFITQKKSRGLHGIGTISINHIVEKYDGVIQNTYQNNVFKSSLMLRCYE